MAADLSQGQRTYERLRDLIVSWELPPGEHLSEVRMSRELGVSRTPLREALHRLDREGLVRITAGRGAVVSEIAVQDVVHLFQMREAVEPYAARLCARRPRREVFAELATAFAGQRAELGAAGPDDDYRHYSELTLALDEAVADAARNPYVVEALRGVRGHLQRLRLLARRRPERMLQTVGEHVAICTAIADGDETAAAAATATHIANSLQNILSVLAEDTGVGASIDLHALTTSHG